MDNLWTKSGQNVDKDFVLNHVESTLKSTGLSKECPVFVQYQGDQVVYF